ncbi:MAG TPA: GNAT family N-acetyltransferase [Phenylobacterium sp.]|nr:GNAT family N-acetyltransferase [Phenylobacterium sp.]
MRLHDLTGAPASMEIVEFEPRHAEAFKTLNEAWISKYFAIEPKDREVLGDPQGRIVQAGGRIFMALHDGEAVGCVALIPMEDGGYEVAKMTVSETLRGSGLGRMLMQRCIDAGAQMGAPRLYLETNSSLGPALGLYRAMGFTDAGPPPRSDYARGDTWMERVYAG